MRNFIVAATLATSLVLATSIAQATDSTTAPAAHAAYTTADTDIGTLLDDPAARAILDKYIPELSKGDNIDMARGMTLKAVQQFAPDMITDEKLTKVDSDLAKLAAK